MLGRGNNWLWIIILSWFSLRGRRFSPGYDERLRSGEPFEDEADHGNAGEKKITVNVAIPATVSTDPGTELDACLLTAQIKPNMTHAMMDMQLSPGVPAISSLHNDAKSALAAILRQALSQLRPRQASYRTLVFLDRDLTLAFLAAKITADRQEVTLHDWIEVLSPM